MTPERGETRDRHIRPQPEGKRRREPTAGAGKARAGSGRTKREKNKNNQKIVKPLPKRRSTDKFAKPTILDCVPQ